MGPTRRLLSFLPILLSYFDDDFTDGFAKIEYVASRIAVKLRETHQINVRVYEAL